MESTLTCKLCSAASHLKFNVTDYIKHIKMFHAFMPGFKVTCGIDGCLRTYSNLGTFLNHVSGVHGDVCTRTTGIIPTINPEVLDQDGEESEEHEHNSSDTDSSLCDSTEYEHTTPTDCDLQAISQEVMQKSSALVLLGLKEKFKLTQVSVQGIVQSMTGLSQQHTSVLKTQVFEILKETNVTGTQKERLEACFKQYEDPFPGLHTQYQQIQCYRKHFNLIEPVRIPLGSRHVWRGQGAKRKCVPKEDSIIYVPILQTLQSLLTNETVLLEVERGHKSTSVIRDFCDGKCFASHPVYSADASALQIFFYFDELEVCNPLGSKTKVHKLGCFYFALGNLSPKYRSQLSSIQLVSLVKSSFITTYGMDSILKPLVDDLKKLEQGVEFVIRGEPKIICGTLAVISADNLGSLALGGFKGSCTALKMCRHCMSTKEQSQKQFLEKHFELRDKTNHEQHCSLIETDLSGDKSKEFGINRNSILNSLAYFNVCDGSLLPDVMHDLLEGVLQYEVKLMLHLMIQLQHYFSLNELNTRLQHLELGYMESNNRPTLLSTKTLNSEGNSLKQNASQMWLFGRILPLLIGEFVPDEDEHWELFLRLMEIVDLLFAPSTSDDHAAYIAVLINDHHEDFGRLYPGYSIIPKMHFMIHMPRLMIQFGPLVRHWTMRFEAKHSYFKRLTHIMGNFVNLPYSLALRHQLYQCYLHANMQYLEESVEVGTGCIVQEDSLQEDEDNSSSLKCKWVKVDGYEYKLRTGVILDVEDDLPIVGIIQEIHFGCNNKVILTVQQFSTIYVPHYRAYVLETSETSTKAVYQCELFIPVPVHLRTSHIHELTNYFIILPYALICT